MAIHGKLTVREKGMNQGIALAVQILMSETGDAQAANSIIASCGLTFGEMRTSKVDQYDFQKLRDWRDSGELEFPLHPSSFPLSDVPASELYKLLGQIKGCSASKKFAKGKTLKAAWNRCTHPNWLHILARDSKAYAMLPQRVADEARNIGRNYFGSTQAKRFRELVPYDVIRRAIKSEFGI